MMDWTTRETKIRTAVFFALGLGVGLLIVLVR
jgi:hypothetical protein